MTNPRLIAAKTLSSVLIHGNQLNDSLINKNLQQETEAKQRALIQALCYSVLRYLSPLNACLSRLMPRPLRGKEHVVKHLILIGLYQILYQQKAHYAAVNEAVEAVKLLKKSWANSLVNGVLRNSIREREALLTSLDNEPQKWSHPNWMRNMIKADWPQHWQTILSENNKAAPMWVRYNTRKLSLEDYIEQLDEHHINCTVHQEIPSALQLNHPLSVQDLPGFSQGEVSVQDAAAQLAAYILKPEPDQLILDACAAPGGKTLHLLQMQPKAIVHALELKHKRVERMQENFQRCGLSAVIKQADAGDVAKWWDGVQYDKILLDAPCTGSGVIRRHPDIKWLRSQQDLNNVMLEQQKLLLALWPTLKPGGLLLYATCSIFKQENQYQIQEFLQGHQDAEIKNLNYACGISSDFGMQILPGSNDMDGFYFALIHKLP